jgi:uncharacterized protein (DUF427 family)
MAIESMMPARARVGKSKDECASRLDHGAAPCLNDDRTNPQHGSEAMPPRPMSALPASSWSGNPGYVIDLAALPCRLWAEVAGAPLLESDRALVMLELGHTPVYYLSREDLRMERLERNDHATHCPYKGDASYWDLRTPDGIIENIVWSYEDPYPEMAAIKGLVGIYWNKMEAWAHDGRRVDRPVEIAGRVNETNNFAKCYPDLATEWHREKNPRLQPYEFAADSPTEVWWLGSDGREWRAPIRDRVLKAAAGVAVQAAAAAS